MPKTTSDFEKVKKVGLTLPGVTEEKFFGAPALKLHGEMLACTPTHRSAEPNSFVLRVDKEQRADLLAIQPDIYYLPDHYAGYDGVLVRLDRVDPAILKDLLGMAHKYISHKSKKRSSPPKRSSRKSPRR
jgi:hypothetical protein